MVVLLAVHVLEVASDNVGLIWGFGAGIHTEPAMEGSRRHAEAICHLPEPPASQVQCH